MKIVRKRVRQDPFPAVITEDKAFAAEQLADEKKKGHKAHIVKKGKIFQVMVQPDPLVVEVER